MCNFELESIGNVVGTVAAVSNPVLEYERTWLTAVAVTTTQDHTVAILGTGDGFIKKVSNRTLLFYRKTICSVFAEDDLILWPLYPSLTIIC